MTRSRLSHGCTLIFSGFLLTCWLTTSGGSPGLVAYVLFFAALGAFRPLTALLFLAALTPMSTPLAVLLNSSGGGFALSEASTVAFVASHAAHRLVQGAGGPPVAGPSWPLVGWPFAVLLSGFVNAYGAISFHELTLDRFTAGPPGDPVYSAVSMSIGPLLAIATIATLTTTRSVAQLMLALTVGVAGAAVLNVNRLLEAAVRADSPLERFIALVLAQRVNVHFPDLNAAGSWFAMAAIAAAGLAWAGSRRWTSGALAGLALVGVLLSGSRAAVAAIVVVVVALTVAGRVRGRLLVRAAGILLLAVALAAAVHLRRAAESESMGDAVEFRVGMVHTAWDMFTDHPVLGVGPGQFHRESAQYMPEKLRLEWFPNENAHNNFLQILAETGTVGMCLFLGLLVQMFRGLRRRPSPCRYQLAAGAAIVTFLITCLSGHPLLIPPVALGFWLLLGAAAARPSVVHGVDVGENIA